MKNLSHILPISIRPFFFILQVTASMRHPGFIINLQMKKKTFRLTISRAIHPSAQEFFQRAALPAKKKAQPSVEDITHKRYVARPPVQKKSSLARSRELCARFYGRKPRGQERIFTLHLAPFCVSGARPPRYKKLPYTLFSPAAFFPCFYYRRTSSPVRKCRCARRGMKNAFPGSKKEPWN